MKSVNVVAAIICDDYKKKTKIFATQRGYGDYNEVGHDNRPGRESEMW